MKIGQWQNPQICCGMIKFASNIKQDMVSCARGTYPTDLVDRNNQLFSRVHFSIFIQYADITHTQKKQLKWETGPERRLLSQSCEKLMILETQIFHESYAFG